MANISHFTQTVNGVSTTYDIHDANAVDLTNNQTVGGNKNFTGTTGTHDVIPTTTDAYDLGSSTNKWKTINGYDVTGIGHIGSSIIDQSGDVQTYARTNPNLGDYAHYCVAPDNGWVACREHGGNGTFYVCSLGSNLNADPFVSSPPLGQYKFGSIPVRKGEYYAILSDNETASHTMRFVSNNG